MESYFIPESFGDLRAACKAQVDKAMQTCHNELFRVDPILDHNKEYTGKLGSAGWHTSLGPHTSKMLKSDQVCCIQTEYSTLGDNLHHGQKPEFSNTPPSGLLPESYCTYLKKAGSSAKWS